ncbi:glycoside hydrolase family 78 protein [Salinibacterium sp. SYSU T00001]|uniref:glycoside hydrolase family 78 protein n=1 Tax=Homoserinimonas sedimenticola TaxID=2986805 RepID=UPI002235ABCB|nr:glycoside hydrolase family 78 protein [Salinibacterium sedimenticola]MCW4386241.1 glycoside hydrolase family 78 protein [Salinibacterium sedimenticola]
MGEWRAEWITHDTGPAGPGRRPVVHFRRQFAVSRDIRATLRITAHGIYQGFLDGVRIGDHELAPGYTEYGSRLQVQEFALDLHAGEHCLAVELSDGWYRGQVGLYRHADQWGTQTALLAQLDGDGVDVATDKAWQARAADHTADLIAGECIDLRSLDGWQHPGYDDSGWEPVAVEQRGYETLVPQEAPPVRRIEELAPRSIRRLGDRQIIDFGQNVAGWTRLARLGPRGTELTLTHAEALTPEGDVTQVNLAPDIPALGVKLPAGQVDTVISAGPGSSFEPRHSTRGFRYLAVDGLDDDLEAQDVTAVVVHSDLPRTGWFTCSDPSLNALHEAAVWSFRGNAIDIPTDCPVRERAGWTGDWQIFVPTAAYLYDVADFSAKWLRDLAAGQWPDGTIGNFAPMPRGEGRESPGAFMNGSAGWGDAAIIVPWELYRAYGDPAVLEESWPMMLRWIGRVRELAETGRHASRTGPVQPHERYLWDSGFHFGEWLVPEPSGDFDFGELMAADKGDTATAYYRHSTRLLSQIAAVLGREEQAAAFAELAQRIRSAWQREYLVDGRVQPATQANCVRALAFDLVDDPAPVVQQLVELIEAAGDHLATGFLATPYLLPVLAEHGRADVAFRLLQQRSWPSWLGMIEQGATTMWERWEGYDASGMPFESHNHYSKGAVISFLHRHVAGIRPVEPGYRRFSVQPVMGGGLGHAEGRLVTPLGEIVSVWELSESRFELSVTVPAGATAEVVLPDGGRHEVAEGRHFFTASRQN